MTTEQDRRKWAAQLRAVSKERRRQIITDAKDKGGLSYQEIADQLGDVTRQRVIVIVREVREERLNQKRIEQTNG